MGSIVAKVFGVLALVMIAFSLLLFMGLVSSRGGGIGFISLAAIFGLIAFGAWFIGNIFGILAMVFSSGSRDIFTGVILILISILHFIPVGFAVNVFFTSPTIGLRELFITSVLLLIGFWYLVAGLDRIGRGRI